MKPILFTWNVTITECMPIKFIFILFPLCQSMKNAIRNTNKKLENLLFLMVSIRKTVYY
ncbi:hypothetical protein HMPREF0758_4056 [Serratia odorifera DSM 4582]|uniref:Uncharacterized protein n=1 Tax=Serratia odorifera DSM 4582 TaxID=667129 RepID=D4E7A6_SEROD|nr:hypothetical protein HMPREF0758_4056 [Serratia odorifera DSM 4582]